MERNMYKRGLVIALVGAILNLIGGLLGAIGIPLQGVGYYQLYQLLP